MLSPWTESHSELETLFNLKDGKRLNWAKVEFTPKDLVEAYKPETYSLKIDEERKPKWFNSEMEESVTTKLRDYIKRIIVSGDVELLVGGQFIIAPGAKIGKADCMVINVLCGGTVNDIWGGTVNCISGGTVNYIRGGTVNDMNDTGNPTIKNISKGATIVRDNRKTK